MDGQKERKKWSRNQGAGFTILYSALISAGLGLLFAAFTAIFEDGAFLQTWLNTFAALIALIGGFPLGGLLTLIFQEWDEEFCTKAGNILWYGTTVGGYALSQLLKFDLGRGVFIAAFVISALVCSILKDWGEHGEGKEAAKTSIIIILSLVEVAYAFSIRAHNEGKTTNVEKEKAAYDNAYDEGYQQGCKDQEESDREKLTIEGKSIVDVEEQVYKYYGLKPYEAWNIIDAYNYDSSHDGITWEEYQNAIEAAVSTAGFFPAR